MGWVEAAMIYQLTLLRNHEVTFKMSASAHFTKCSLPGSAENMQVYVSVCTSLRGGCTGGCPSRRVWSGPRSSGTLLPGLNNVAVIKPCAQGRGLRSRWEGERETREGGPVLTLLEGTFSAGAQAESSSRCQGC